MPEQSTGVVVGTDLTEGTDTAIVYALHEAARRRTGLQLLTVIDLPTHATARHGLPEWVLDVDKVRDRARQDAAARLDAMLIGPTGDHDPQLRNVPVTIVAAIGNPAEQLTRAAASAQLLVVGHHHRSRWGRLTMGSVALRCALEAVCPTVVVPEPQEAALDHETVAPDTSGRVVTA